MFSLFSTLGCKGCDPLDPRNFVDVKQFYPDMPEAMPDMSEPDMGPPPTDGGRTPTDANFTFDFGDPPEMGELPFAIDAVVPNAGPLEGGQRVRIQGTGLKQGSTVFVGANRMEVELSTGTLVGDTPPANAPGAATVKVISPDGEVRALVDAYRYVPRLGVDAIVPDRVPTTGGVEVELRGAGFTPTMGVSLSGTPALRVTVEDENLARVLVPPRPRGFADLRVTTPDASVELDDAVQYFDPLRITAVEPASGTTAGGETVVLTGTGFTSTTRVRFGGEELTIDSIDAQNGTIRATTPAGPAGAVDVFAWNSVDSTVLPDGFYYRADDTPTLAGVHPASGPVSGGNVVRVIGWGLAGSGTSIQFGGAVASVVTATPSWADVTVPAGSEGPVDVALVSGGSALSTLPAAYSYERDLRLTSAAPDRGPATGGTTVVLRGSGFVDAETVLVGGVPADFSVSSDTEISLTTPPHTAGTVDIDVFRGSLDASLEDAFTYESVLEVWGFSPVRGAIAGGTYVEVRGRGFVGEVGVTVDGAAGSDVRRVDQNTLTFRTPAHAPGEAVIEVSAGSMAVLAPYTYQYFDPASRFGGASGGGVEGSVNVTVFALGGGPIPNAFVMLSTRSDTPFQGWTDANGQVTLSGPEVLGSQTTTATAAGYSSATITTVDAENVTLFLNRTDPASGGGAIEPPPFGTISGTIRATGKLSDPADSATYDMAVVATTTPTIYGSNPPAGPDAIVVGEGRYRIRTRIGDMAVVGLCGSYHQPTDTFTPQFMAVERFVFVADQDELEIDLLCDVPLDQTHVYKLINAPYAPTGPNQNVVEVYWDFGFEGFFLSPSFGQGFGSLVSVGGQPALAGDIADISFTAVGGAYTNFGAPLSQATKRNVTQVARPVELPVLLDVPEPLSPLPGGTVQDGVIRFQAAGPYRADFQYIVLRNAMGIPVWTFIVPGDTTSLKLPEFPDFSGLPAAERPNPFPGGSLYLTIVGVRVDGGHEYERFSYRDIDEDLWEAYSLTTWVVRLK